jgi:hypothetical protein
MVKVEGDIRGSFKIIWHDYNLKWQICCNIEENLKKNRIKVYGIANNTNLKEIKKKIVEY